MPANRCHRCGVPLVTGLNDRNHECDATDEMYFGGWFEEEN